MSTEEIEINTAEAGSASDTSEKKAESLTPETEEKSDVQVEPTQEEMERERLASKAEQLQDEIQQLREKLHEKEEELAEIKKQLGITAFTEFKQSMAHGLKVVEQKFKDMQESETYHKIDDKLTGWKTKVEESQAYQKTKTAFSDAGAKVQEKFTAVKESDTVKNISEKTSSGLKRAGTVIKESGTAAGGKISSAAHAFKEKVWSSTDQPDGGEPTDNRPTTGETVVPDAGPPKE